MKYYSAMKRNEILSHEKIHRGLKCIRLSERSQSEKILYCLISTIWHFGKGKTIVTLTRSVVVTGKVKGWTKGRRNEKVKHSGVLGQ